MSQLPGNRPTLKDVAYLADTSIATASNVLSDRDDKYVSEELAQRVRRAAETLGYRPNLVARSMKGKSRNLVAVLIPEFWNPVFTRIVVGAEQVARENGYLLLICSTEGDPQRQEEYLHNLAAQQVDGYLITPVSEDGGIIERMASLNLPFAVVDRPVASSADYDLVAYDMKSAAIRGVDYLVRHGHRRIGFIGWDAPVVRPRLEGFALAIRDAGLNPEECPVHLGELSRDSGAALARECIEHGDITALFIGHHHIGEGAMAQIAGMGIGVPDDLSVVVFGNPTWTQIVMPGLTCMDMPDAEMGRTAMEMLIASLRGTRRTTAKVWLDCKLVERGSVRNISGNGTKETKEVQNSYDA